MKICVPDIKRTFYQIALLAILSGTGLQVTAQTTGDFRSRQTGNWNSSSTWQIYNGSTWVNASSYPGQSAGTPAVDIQNGHVVTVTAAVPNTISSLNINGGTSDSYLSFNSSGSLTVTGQTYLNSNSNNDEKSVLVDAGTFNTGSVNANSNGNTRDAYIRISTGTVTVSGNISLNSTELQTYILFTGSGTLYVGGSISGGTITSTTGGGTAAPTSGTVTYNGTASQAIGSYSYYGLTVNNSAGVTTGSDITVSGILTMTSGNINTSTNTLILSNSSVTALSYSSGTIIGRFRRAVSSPLNVAYLFPVGNGTYHRAAVMSFSSLSASTNITAQFVEDAPANFVPYTDNGQTLNNAFSEGYWRFTSSSLPTANYSLTLTAAGFSSYTFDSYARITARDNSNSTWRAIGTHGTLSGSNISRTGVTSMNTTSFDFAVATCYTQLFLGYAYERNITIDHSMVQGGSDLYNFPLMISLSGESFLRNHPAGDIYNSNGYDIIFTDANYNTLDHQVEHYNGTNGDLIVWVRIPTLSASANTVIKIIYGNPAITANPSVTTVWDSHYKGVWHLDDNNLFDFTSYGFAGTPYNTPTYNTGVINNAMELNGTNEYAQVNNAPHLNFAGNITVSAWVYMDTRTRDQKIASNQNNISGGYKFGIYTNNKVEFEIRTSTNVASLNRDVSGGTVLNTGQWYYLAGISSDVLDSIKTFVNGVSERPFRKSGTLGVASNNLVIGKEPFESNYYFDGRFDELRISDEVRSDGWMRTEYNNQSSPSTYISVDASGTEASNLPSESICTGPITLNFGYPAGGIYSGNPYISGTTFTPPSAGTYPVTYTYIGGCGSSSITKDFVITETPDAPTAPDMEYCQSQITYLEATSGENIKWYSGGTLVSTANPFSTGQTVPGTYNYTVTQTVNGCESDHTSVTLTIFSGITISAQPQATSVCVGHNALFTVTAAGYNLSYRWQENGVNLSDGGIYSGTTTPTLTLTSPALALSGRNYRCVITTTCGSSVTSSSALLTVNPVPVATFSYTGSPYCPNAADPYPTFSGGGVAGTFSSTAGLVFVSTSTGQIDLSASTPGTYTVTNTISATGGCSAVSATSGIEIVSSLTWTGSVSSDWNTAGNWSCSYVPGNLFSVIIPDVTNDPVISSGAAAAVNNIQLQAGASLTVSGNILSIHGTISGSGLVNASAGTVEFSGSAAQTIPAGLFVSNRVMHLTVNNSAGVTVLGTLNVRGVLLVQSGTLHSDGYLTLLSDASGTALIDGSGSGSVSGTVTMQRYLSSGFGYRYFSSPFQSATVSEFGDDMDLGASFPTFYRYDESRTASGWVAYATGTNSLVPLSGYAINFGSSAGAITADVSGTVNGGPLSVTLYNHNNTYTQGFNLVGNPYPSPIDWDAAGWTRSNIDDAVWYFRASATDQYGGTYSSYVNGVSSDPGVATNVIPSMQGFFVHVSDGTYPVTGQLGLNNTVRINNLTHAFLKSAATEKRFLIRASAGFTGADSLSDKLVIYFDDNATAAFDRKYDALKLMNTDIGTVSFFSFNNEGRKLSINALAGTADTILSIPLGVKLYRDGEIKLCLTGIDNLPAGVKIYLRDAETGSSTLVTQGQAYTVSLKSGDYFSRFFLTLHGNITGMESETETGAMLRAWYSQGVIRAEVNYLTNNDGVLYLYDLSGRLWYTGRIYEPGLYEIDGSFRPGIYIVRLVSGVKTSTVKLLTGVR